MIPTVLCLVTVDAYGFGEGVVVVHWAPGPPCLAMRGSASHTVSVEGAEEDRWVLRRRFRMAQCGADHEEDAVRNFSIHVKVTE
jgi:hypothetical protein